MRALVMLLVTSLLLSACGSVNGTHEADIANEFTEENHIKPDEVSAYIDNFKNKFQRISFAFKDKDYSIRFEDFDMENKLLIATYEQGLLLIGFDFEANEPLDNLLVLEGDISNIDEFTPIAEYESDDIELTLDGEESIYQGIMLGSNDKAYPIRLVINESLIEAGASKITVKENKATISGVLGSLTYLQLQSILERQPIDTLVLKNVPGSVNDAINVHTARLVRNAGLTTVMPKDGEAYSGGVDLFAAGKKRIYEDGGKLGVHAWCCLGDKDAGELSKNNPAHNDLLSFYREMMGDIDGPAFYFYTIYAAPADDIKLMTKQEIIQYKLVTP